MVAQQDNWFKIAYAQPEMMDLEGAREWAQTVEWILYDRLAKSNFYAEMSPTIVDAVSVGTAAMYRSYDDATGVPVFNTLHPQELFIDINERKQVDTVYRLFNLTKRQAIEKFGTENLSEEIMNDSVDSTRTFRFVHAVFPRKDTDPDIGLLHRDRESILAVDAPWISIYLELDEEMYGQGSTAAMHQATAHRHDKDKKPIVVGGYQEMPYSVWRWDIDPATPYGMSPTREMLPLIRDLQFFGEMMKEETVMTVRPPLNVPASQQGKARIGPRAMNYSSNPDHKIEAILGTTKDYPFGADRENQLRDQIREGYGVDMFVLIARLTAAGQSKTATEVLELQAEKSAVLASIKRNMGPELLTSTLRWIFHQEVRRGNIPPLPASLQPYRRTQQGGFRVEFIGPLAQAQKRLINVQGPLRIMEAAFQILDRYPTGWDVVNVDRILRYMFLDGGMPADSVFTADETQQMRRMKAERAAQQQMIEDMQGLASAQRNFNTEPAAAGVAGGGGLPSVA